MHFSEWHPSALLSPYIKNYWFLEADSADSLLSGSQRVFPDGCMECIIHYGDPVYTKSYDAEQRQLRAFVFGQLEKYIELVPSAKMRIMGIKFFPNGLSAFCRLPVSEIKEKEIDVSDLFGIDAGELAEKIEESTSFHDKISVAEKFFISQLRGRISQLEISAMMLKDVYDHTGNIGVRDLVEKYGVSEKQVERIFLRHVGLSPKLFSRILRFQNVFKLAATTKSLTNLAIDAGYFDQSHFIREFRAFSGYAPKQYFNTNHGFAQLFLDD